MSKSFAYLSTIAALIMAGLVAPSQAAIMTTPGLLGVRFWEATGPVVPFTFAPNSSEMTNQLGVGVLGPNNDDFNQLPTENYDVFYSDANGNFNLNGNYVTVEAVYPVPGGGGGLNLGAVDLVFGSGTLRADVLASFVGLGPNFIPGSVVNAVDADTAVPSTITTMGSTMIPPTQHLRVTVTWSHLVPEPTSGMLIATALSSVLFVRRRCR
jgi:hypothetical protein